MKMLEKLNDLGFVIGAFFTLVAIVMLGNNLLNGLTDRLSWYTFAVFLVFGIVMMFAPKKKSV